MKRVLVTAGLLLVFVIVGCADKAQVGQIEKLKKDLNACEEKVKSKDNEISGYKRSLSAKDSEISNLNSEKDKALAEKDKALAEMKKTQEDMQNAMQDEIKKGEIAVTQLKDKLTVSMVEAILFESGSADIKKNGKKVLTRVADVLKKVKDKEIRIEGYTDNLPIGPSLVKKFPTNWELSTTRATNVVKYLIDKDLDSKMLSACGYGPNNPVASNANEKGRAKNRRIEIVLVPVDLEKSKVTQPEAPAEAPKTDTPPAEAPKTETPPAEQK